MPAMDETQFNRKINNNSGFSIKQGAKHPYVLAPDNDTQTYAVAHKKGGKRYIKPGYVKQVKGFIESKGGTW